MVRRNDTCPNVGVGICPAGLENRQPGMESGSLGGQARGGGGEWVWSGGVGWGRGECLECWIKGSVASPWQRAVGWGRLVGNLISNLGNFSAEPMPCTYIKWPYPGADTTTVLWAGGREVSHPASASRVKESGVGVGVGGALCLRAGLGGPSPTAAAPEGPMRAGIAEPRPSPPPPRPGPHISHRTRSPEAPEQLAGHRTRAGLPAPLFGPGGGGGGGGMEGRSHADWPPAGFAKL